MNATRARARAVAAFCLHLAAAGCGSAQPPDLVQRRDSAGVQIVVAPTRDAVLAWSLEPVRVLGGDLAGPTTFNALRPDQVGADTDGNIYVLDAADRRIVSFDSLGDFRWAAGREGGGPGEFRSPNSLTVAGGGVILVHDVGKGALIRYASDGRYLGEEPFGYQVIRWGQAVVQSVGDALGIVARSPYDGEDERELSLLLVTASDTSTLLTRRTTLSRTASYPACGMTLTLPVLFAPGVHWSAAGNNLAIALDAEYVVNVFGPAGTLSVRRERAPLAVTESHARAVLTERAIGGPVAPCRASPDEVLRNHGYATHVQIVTGVALAPDGTLWVARRVEGRGDDVAIDVFDLHGDYTGTLPPGTPLPVAFPSRGHAVYALRDELDVERLVIARLRREPPS
jgi:hypothetical protein